MNAAEREVAILSLLGEHQFISFRELVTRLGASPATVRRDLEKLHNMGRIRRMHGGAELDNESGVIAFQVPGPPPLGHDDPLYAVKDAIGKAAAALCTPGEAVIILGGSTTLHMCSHLAPLQLHVLTNSLPIVSALLPQPKTSVSIAGGVLFREQSIVLDPFSDSIAETFQSSRMFIGAAGIGHMGLMQNDVILTQAERKLLETANQLVVLLDSSKFHRSPAHLICSLSFIHTVITDDRIDDASAKLLERHGVKLIATSAAPSPDQKCVA
jgi:DeoR family transcriptional regulator, ulaG and ulaABCDEF operon transcriptional repressor